MDERDAEINRLKEDNKRLRKENEWLWACLERVAINAAKEHNTVVIYPASENAPPARSKPSGYVEGVEAAFPRCRASGGDLASGSSEAYGVYGNLKDM